MTHHPNRTVDFGYLNKYHLEIEKEINRGSYGVVYLVHNCYDSKLKYALKVFFNNIQSKNLMREVLFGMLVKGETGMT